MVARKTHGTMATMSDSEPDMDCKQSLMFDLYAEGLTQAEIAAEVNESQATVSKTLRTWPAHYARAKDKARSHRTAKYRRIAAKAADIQLGELERIQNLVAMEDQIRKEVIELKEIQAREGHSELIHDPDTPLEVLKRVSSTEMLLSQKSREIEDIDRMRKTLKDYNAIYEAAEKRADLNEGKASEILDVGNNLGALLVEIQGKRDGLPSEVPK